MYHLFITDSDFANTDSSFQYLLWFQPSLGAILLGENTCQILLDGRYFSKTRSIDISHVRDVLWKPDLEVSFLKIQSLAKSLNEVLWLVDTVSLQDSIAVRYAQDIQKQHPKLTIQYHSDILEKKRIIKTQQEKQHIKKAIKIIDDTFLYIENKAQKWELHGKTELQVRSMILEKIFEFWGNGESFESIVAFWSNSAVPHHTSGETIIESGPLLIDMGAKYQGYCSDFTRTFWVGEHTSWYEKFQQVYDIVKHAYTEAVVGYEAGATAADLDTLARNIITEGGYGKEFMHSLGHSLWIDIHEPPRISSKDDTILRDGMVFTIEPGIYLENEFGIRLENIVFLEEGQLNTYTQIPL